MNSVSVKTKNYVLLIITFLAFLSLFFTQRIPQDRMYHNFIDHINILTIPNFWNVVTNFFYLFFGLIGLRYALKQKHTQSIIIYSATCFVFVGSSYYHLAPSNDTLVWDRLPMTVVFMSFLSIIISDFISQNRGKQLFFPLIFIGISSVFYWDYTELNNAGDLRFYFLIQFLSLALIFLIILGYYSEFKRNLYIVLGLYFLAKIAEIIDIQLYENIGLSGHSIKHIISSFSIYFFYLYQKKHRTMRSTLENN